MLLLLVLLSNIVFASDLDKKKSESVVFYSPQLHHPQPRRSSTIAHIEKQDQLLTNEQTRRFVADLDNEVGTAYIHKLARIEKARLYSVLLHYNKEGLISEHMSKKEALSLLTKAFTYPGYDENLYDLCRAGFIYEAEGNLDEAVRCFQTSAEPDGLYEAGRILLQQNKVTKAVQLFKQAIHQSNHELAHKALLQINAIEYQTFKTLDPQEQDCFDAIWDHAQHCNNDPKIKKVIDGVLLKRAQLLAAKGQHLQAIDVLKKISKNKQSKQRALLQMADSHRQLGNMQDAIRLYSKMISEDVFPAIALYNRAQLTVTSDPSQARADALKALKLASNNPQEGNSVDPYDMAQLLSKLETDDAIIYKELHQMAKKNTTLGNNARTILKLIGEIPSPFITNPEHLQLMIGSDYTTDEAKQYYRKRLTEHLVQQNYLSVTDAENLLEQLNHYPDSHERRSLSQTVFDKNIRLFNDPKKLQLVVRALHFLMDPEKPQLELAIKVYDSFMIRCKKQKNADTIMDAFIKDPLIDSLQLVAQENKAEWAQSFLGRIYADVGLHCKKEELLKRAATLLDPLVQQPNVSLILVRCAADAHVALADFDRERKSWLSAYNHLARAAELTPAYKWEYGYFVKVHWQAILAKDSTATLKTLCGKAYQASIEYFDQYKEQMTSNQLYKMLLILSENIEFSHGNERFAIDADIKRTRECAQRLLQQIDPTQNALQKKLDDCTLNTTKSAKQLEDQTDIIAEAHFILGKTYCPENGLLDLEKAENHFALAGQHDANQFLSAASHLHGIGQFDLAKKQVMLFFAAEANQPVASFNDDMRAEGHWLLADIAMREQDDREAAHRLRQVERIHDDLLDFQDIAFIAKESSLTLLQKRVAQTVQKETAEVTADEIDTCRIFGKVILAGGNYGHCKPLILSGLQALNFASIQANDPKSTLVLLEHAHDNKNEKLKEKYLNQLVTNFEHIAQGTAVWTKGKSIDHIVEYIEPSTKRMLFTLHPEHKEPFLQFMGVLFPVYSQRLDALFSLIVDTDYASRLGLNEVINSDNRTKLEKFEGAVDSYLLEQLSLASNNHDNKGALEKYKAAVAISCFIKCYRATSIMHTNQQQSRQEMERIIQFIDIPSARQLVAENVRTLYCHALMRLGDFDMVAGNRAGASIYYNRVYEIIRKQPTTFPRDCTLIKIALTQEKIDQKTLKELLHIITPKIKKSNYYIDLITLFMKLCDEEQFSAISDLLKKITVDRLEEQAIIESLRKMEEVLNKKRFCKTADQKTKFNKAVEEQRKVINTFLHTFGQLIYQELMKN